MLAQSFNLLLGFERVLHVPYHSRPLCGSVAGGSRVQPHGIPLDSVTKIGEFASVNSFDLTLNEIPHSVLHDQYQHQHQIKQGGGRRRGGRNDKPATGGEDPPPAYLHEISSGLHGRQREARKFSSKGPWPAGSYHPDPGMSV